MFILGKIIYPFAYAFGWVRARIDHYRLVHWVCVSLRKSEKAVENLTLKQAIDLAGIIELRYVNWMYHRNIDFFDRETFEAWYDVWGDRLIDEYIEYLSVKEGA